MLGFAAALLILGITQVAGANPDRALNWIASIGALAAALATFATVREMAKQRHLSVLPKILLDGPSTYAVRLDKFDGIEFLKWYDPFKFEPDASFADLIFTLRNGGAGAVTGIEVEWTYDGPSKEELLEDAPHLAENIEDEFGLSYDSTSKISVLTPADGNRPEVSLTPTGRAKNRLALALLTRKQFPQRGIKMHVVVQGQSLSKDTVRARFEVRMTALMPDSPKPLAVIVSISTKDLSV